MEVAVVVVVGIMMVVAVTMFNYLLLFHSYSHYYPYYCQFYCCFYCCFYCLLFLFLLSFLLSVLLFFCGSRSCIRSLTVARLVFIAVLERQFADLLAFTAFKVSATPRCCSQQPVKPPTHLIHFSPSFQHFLNFLLHLPTPPTSFPHYPSPSFTTHFPSSHHPPPFLTTHLPPSHHPPRLHTTHLLPTPYMVVVGKIVVD